MKVTYHPIGIIQTPFKSSKGMPIQPKGAEGIKGKVILEKGFIRGLIDLEGFSHIYLIYHFHLSSGYALKVIPFLDNTFRGVFATRAPRRPNAIGISVVRLIKIHDNILDIENVDIMNDTPLLDIKPYTAQFDYFEDVKNGWLDKSDKKIEDLKSDDRFS